MNKDELKKTVIDSTEYISATHRAIIFPLGDYLTEHGCTEENPLDISSRNIDVWGWFGGLYEGTYERVTKVAVNDDGDPIYANDNHEEWYEVGDSMNTSESFFLAMAVAEIKI